MSYRARNLHPVRTCHIHRYHMHMDIDAREYNSFRIDLMHLDYEVHAKAGESLDELWPSVVVQLARLRAQYNAAPVYPLALVQPFAVIVLQDWKREAALLGVKIQMLCGNAYQEEIRHEIPSDHIQAVQSLCNALDHIAYIEGKPVRVIQ